MAGCVKRVYLLASRFINFKKLSLSSVGVVLIAVLAFVVRMVITMYYNNEKEGEFFIDKIPDFEKPALIFEKELTKSNCSFEGCDIIPSMSGAFNPKRFDGKVRFQIHWEGGDYQISDVRMAYSSNNGRQESTSIGKDKTLSRNKFIFHDFIEEEFYLKNNGNFMIKGEWNFPSEIYVHTTAKVSVKDPDSGKYKYHSNAEWKLTFGVAPRNIVPFLIHKLLGLGKSGVVGVHGIMRRMKTTLISLLVRMVYDSYPRTNSVADGADHGTQSALLIHVGDVTFVDMWGQQDDPFIEKNELLCLEYLLAGLDISGLNEKGKPKTLFRKKFLKEYDEFLTDRKLIVSKDTNEKNAKEFLQSEMSKNESLGVSGLLFFATAQELSTAGQIQEKEKGFLERSRDWAGRKNMDNLIVVTAWNNVDHLSQAKTFLKKELGTSFSEDSSFFVYIGRDVDHSRKIDDHYLEMIKLLLRIIGIVSR